MVRHFGRGRTQGTRARYAWVPHRDVENATVSGTDFSADLLSLYLTDSGRDIGPGFVVERILGSMIVTPTTIGDSGDFTFGISTCPEGAWLSTPSPDTEIHNWLVWQSGLFGGGGDSEFAAGSFEKGQRIYQFDVRSRRKLTAMGDEVRCVFANRNGDSVTWSLNTRILLRVSA